MQGRNQRGHRTVLVIEAGLDLGFLGAQRQEPLLDIGDLDFGEMHPLGSGDQFGIELGAVVAHRGDFARQLRGALFRHRDRPAYGVEFDLQAGRFLRRLRHHRRQRAKAQRRKQCGRGYPVGHFPSLGLFATHSSRRIFIRPGDRGGRKGL